MKYGLLENGIPIHVRVLYVIYIYVCINGSIYIYIYWIMIIHNIQRGEHPKINQRVSQPSHMEELHLLPHCLGQVGQSQNTGSLP